MKFIVLALAAVAGVGARSVNSGSILPAGNIGTSGILRRDGSTDLFSHDFAHDIIAVGPSGIVTKSGRNVQLDADLNLVRAKRSAEGAGPAYIHPLGNIGTSGILRKDGSTELFSHDFAHDILLIGPAGIVTKSGRNIQMTEDLRLLLPSRTKRSAPAAGPSYIHPRGNIGASGILRTDGSTELFSHDFAHDILLIGPAGIVTKSGRNIQMTEDLRLLLPSRTKRSAPAAGPSYIHPRGNIGASGILRTDGSTELFSHDFAHDILLIGPAGIVTKSGRNIQMTEDLRLLLPSRTKRSAPAAGPSYIHPRGNIGASGILRTDGSTELFSHDFAHDILLIGPAGIVTKSGRNIQMTEDLRLLLPSRTKRSAPAAGPSYIHPRGNIGASGILRTDGSTELFSHDFAHDILLIGPAGIVTKSGRNIQMTEDLRLLLPSSA